MKIHPPFLHQKSLLIIGILVIASFVILGCTSVTPNSTPIKLSDVPLPTPTITPTITPTKISGTWVIRILDSKSNVGGFFSLAVDSLGNPHVVYFDENNEDLLYNTRKNGSWFSAPMVVTDRSVGLRAGYMASIVIGSDNLPHISYLALDTRRVYVSHWDGSQWVHDRVDPMATDLGESLIGMDTSLAVDSDGDLHLIYLDVDRSYVLQYYVNKNGRWNLIKGDGLIWVDPSGVTVPIAVYNNIASVAYYDSGIYYLPLVGEWTPQPIELGSDIGLMPALEFDAQGRPHVIYYDAVNRQLKHACLIDSHWVIDIIQSDIKIGRYPGIAIDPDGGIHVSYYDKLNGDLLYAYRAPGESEFQSTIVDSQGIVGTFSSIGLNADGLPMIIYFDDDSKNLKFAELSLK